MENPESVNQTVELVRELDDPETVSNRTFEENSDSNSFTICVCSNDAVWANLLGRNLRERGLRLVQCSLRDLKSQIASLGKGSWIVVDGGWPMLELQELITELNQLLRESHVRTVVAVDELVGPHPLDAFESDTVIKRTADMRILVQDLLSLFQSYLPGSMRPA